jgi:hypothetical protein
MKAFGIQLCSAVPVTNVKDPILTQPNQEFFLIANAKAVANGFFRMPLPVR